MRISYSDLMGTDRGRDVLIEAMPGAMSHGLAFCRAAFHTSPMGDVVPVQGGIESGLPDITVRPDLSTLTPVPWDDGVAWCLADVMNADGTLAMESPRTVLRAVDEQHARVCNHDKSDALMPSGTACRHTASRPV